MACERDPEWPCDGMAPDKPWRWCEGLPCRYVPADDDESRRWLADEALWAEWLAWIAEGP